MTEMCMFRSATHRGRGSPDGYGLLVLGVRDWVFQHSVSQTIN